MRDVNKFRRAKVVKKTASMLLAPNSCVTTEIVAHDNIARQFQYSSRKDGQKIGSCYGGKKILRDESFRLKRQLSATTKSTVA